jgi:hypothetical protein
VFVVANFALIRAAVVALALIPFPAHAATFDAESARHESAPIRQYEQLLERVLPCPAPVLRDTTDLQLCLLIIPPGHRENEREMLLVITSKHGQLEATLRRAAVSLWSFIQEDSAETSLDGLKVSTVRLVTKGEVEAVIGSSWLKHTIDLMPLRDWFTDPTTYRFQTDTVTAREDVRISGPGRASRRQPSQLLTWAEVVRAKGEKLLDAAPPVPLN